MYEVLFQYGPYTFRTFNLFLAIAFLVGFYLLLRYLQRNKLRLRFLLNNFAWLILGPLVGGRVFYLFEHSGAFSSDPLSAFYFWDLHYSPFGLMYTGLITLYLLCQKDAEDFWAWLDGVSLAGLASLTLVNLGYFFDGSHYGKPTELPFGFSFDTINIPFTTPIHATQLYTAGAAFLIYLFMVKYNKRTHLSGTVGSLAILLYSLASFGIDFLRSGASSYTKFNLGLIAAIAFIAYIHTTHKSHLNSNR